MTNTTDYENDDDEDEPDLSVREPDHDSSGPRAQEKNYTILSESDVRARQDHDIHTLSAVLSISPAASAALLSHHNWCLTTVVTPGTSTTPPSLPHASTTTTSHDLTCTCSHRFCWNCCEEVHRPVDCVTATKWVAKNLDEAQNVEWWLPLNPKACPKCGMPVEKRDGCMRVACARGPWCAHEFCWLCLREWSAHGGPCNGFERGRGGAPSREAGGWSRGSRSSGGGGGGGEEEGLFEFLQGAAETELERLHKLMEVDLEAEGRCKGFLEFREEIVNLTRVTRRYFENLVRAVEKGLEM
ncbi:putative E3 ubiquitin-protein ligase ARI5 [Acorus calamus]|uniref:E3 ubiquitin-protein ligase ARI5 n=1 Tax=Acorus calamus TaxID=4465 RepID=A0AAV9CE62_ACOCL|nr:putative E3 ubiquitin-protein ligase ARI5 [Acorus calamus]